MESIQGLVEHIVYHNDTNGYTVFSLMCQGEEIVCVGNVTSLDEGEYLKAEGEYTEHQVYGRQFKVTSMSVEVPEDEYSIERYLGSGAIRGVGPSLAARIVKKLKKNRSGWLRSRASVNAKPGRSISSFMRSRICVRP